jgi:lipopolysaccharide export system protein LptA
MVFMFQQKIKHFVSLRRAQRSSATWQSQYKYHDIATLASRPRNDKYSLAFLFLMFFFNSVYALPTDKDQPMYVNANTGHVDKKTGISVFQGNVKATQGSSILLADTVMLHTDKNNHLIEADAQGNLANYSTLTDVNKPRYVAVAQKIQYFPDKTLIVLIGNAKAVQGPNSYAAPRIEYNTAAQTVVSRASPNGRTVIVIQPSLLQKQAST